MPLTAEQEAAAKRAYIESMLSPECLAHTHALKSAKDELDIARQVYSKLQKACSHPLVARDTKNRGNTGNWDRGDDSYWTEHHCTLCDMRWTTGQRWQHVGGRQGHPDDPDAKEC